MEEALHCRSSLDSNLRPNCASVQEDFCLLRDSSSTASDSGAFRWKCTLRKVILTLNQYIFNIFSGTTESVGNESNRETLKSSPLLNNRREQRAYITHLDRSEKERERKRMKIQIQMQIKNTSPTLTGREYKFKWKLRNTSPTLTENKNTDVDKKYITNLDRHSAKDRATLLAPTPQSSPKKSPKTSRSLGKSQSKDPGTSTQKQNTIF